MCISFLKDQLEKNINSRTNIVIPDIDIKEQFNKFKESPLEEFRDLKTDFFIEVNSNKKLVSHEMS